MTNQNTIVVPDIGGASGVDVIEILVKPGDVIEKDTPLVTLESDKASMEIPSSTAGIIETISVKIGDKVSEGDVIVTLKSGTAEASKPAAETKTATEAAKPEVKAEAPTPAETTPKETAAPSAPIASHEIASADLDSEDIYAGPGVRRLAYELDIHLADVSGTGRKARITKEDLQNYVKQRLKGSQQTSGLGLPAAPAIDFSKFGPVESKPLNKIKKITGANMQRAWLTVPHVTQFDEADITDLEAFRKAEGGRLKGENYKLTLLAFVTKIIASALKVFPQFNASLDASGEQLIYKQYINIGIAVETPNGLVVPVIKGVDQLSVLDIAKEMAHLSQKAREKGLMPTDMNGGCFTISSLGGIGGTAFTPIVNTPEVAILGLSRSAIKPVYIDNAFQPRLMLPLSLSYDHRVIDGAEAARFTRYIADSLQDMRRILL